MKTNKYFKAVIAAVFIISVVIIQFHTNLLFKNSFHITYSDVVYATYDTDGNQIILDSAGQRLLKVNSEDEALFSVEYGLYRGKGLNHAVNVITDDQNHIYILNLTKAEGSYQIKKEEIIEYSPEGKYLGTVFSMEHESPVLVNVITGLYRYGGELAYIITEEDSFALYDNKNELIKRNHSKGIGELVINYAIHPDTGEIYYSTKQGKILKYIDETKTEQLYDANEYEYLSVPRDLSFDQQGNLYFTDIGLRTVTSISSDNKITQIIYEGIPGEEISSKKIYNYMNAGFGVVAVTSDYTVTYQQGVTTNHYEADYNLVNCLWIIAVWFAVAIVALILMFLIYKIILTIVRKGSREFFMGIGITVGTIFIAVIIILMIIPKIENRLLDSVLKRAQVISDMIGMVVPIEDYRKLDSTADYLSKEYIAVRDSVNEAFSMEKGGIADYYCVLYSYKNHIISGTYSLAEYSGAIYPYDWTYEGSDEQWIIENGTGMEYTDVVTNEGKYLFVLNPLFDENNKVIGLIEVGTDLNSFQKETNKMIVEMLISVIAITIVIILVMLEIMIFLKGRKEYISLCANNTMKYSVPIPNELLRILVFGIFFITNITTSILPLHSLNIAADVSAFGIPKEVLAAMPISAEVIFGALFSLLGGSLIRKLGGRNSAILGSFLFLTGLCIRFVLPNIWILTLGNSIMGCGWGILLLMVNMIIAMGDDEDKDKGFAGYTAAAFSGINSGIVFGGFLVYWLDYKAIFIVAAGLSLLILTYTLHYLTKFNMMERKTEEKDILSDITLFRFLIDKKVMAFFIMIAIPVITCGYFLYYLFPILGTKYGLTESHIGYAYLFNGLCVICFSKILTQYLSKKVKKAHSLVIASLLYALGFLCVAVFQNVFSLIAVLILLGLSDSFGLSLQTSYYTDLDAVKRYGYGKSIGIYSLFENIAQSAGAFVFSYVLLIGVQKGLGVVLSLLVILALIFGLLSLRKKRTDH